MVIQILLDNVQPDLIAVYVKSADQTSDAEEHVFCQLPKVGRSTLYRTGEDGSPQGKIIIEEKDDS